MTVLDAVVEMTTDLLAVDIAQLLHGGAVGAKPVGHDPLRGPVALECFLHEAERRLLVALPRDVALEDLAFVIDGPPQLVLLAVHLHDQFVEVPLPVLEPAHPTDPLAANVAGEERTEPVPPVAHGLMGNVDTSLEQQVLDVAERQRVLHIEHHRQADDLGREIEVAERRGWDFGTGHAAALPCPS